MGPLLCLNVRCPSQVCAETFSTNGRLYWEVLKTSRTGGAEAEGVGTWGHASEGYMWPFLLLLFLSPFFCHMLHDSKPQHVPISVKLRTMDLGLKYTFPT